MRIGYNASMERRRLRLIALFAVGAVIVFVASAVIWIHTRLLWIQQRHEFFDRYESRSLMADIWPEPPWQLRLFGEERHLPLCVRADRMAEAQRLFPESRVLQDSFPNAR
jgi:hypothetical protein